MSIFSRKGFDTVIGKGSTLIGDFVIAASTTAVIEGTGYLSSVTESKIDDKKGKTTLRVDGLLVGPGWQDYRTTSDKSTLDIEVSNVIITGKVVCETIRVEGTLAVKAGATLMANKILYRELIIETGAVVHGQMAHLDHVSEGEQV
jgi:cytoskeletal protein CcmA (bactofilin family)